MLQRSVRMAGLALLALILSACQFTQNPTHGGDNEPHWHALPPKANGLYTALPRPMPWTPANCATASVCA